mmetsp:Transcript_10840/g.34889  ORF Transcript_10840/g.34889 Transcript_10840/m.34889 type:complete len:213 (+) Transcript_10840:667-1305(+)
MLARKAGGPRIPAAFRVAPPSVATTAPAPIAPPPRRLAAGPTPDVLTPSDASLPPTPRSGSTPRMPSPPTSSSNGALSASMAAARSSRACSSAAGRLRKSTPSGSPPRPGRACATPKATALSSALRFLALYNLTPSKSLTACVLSSRARSPSDESATNMQPTTTPSVGRPSSSHSTSASSSSIDARARTLPRGRKPVAVALEAAAPTLRWSV